MIHWNGDTLRDLERRTIGEFVIDCAHLFSGRRVLDYGCGKQPYRDVIEQAGGVYEGHDRAAYPANVSGEDVGAPLSRWYDVIVTTQVIQYQAEPQEFLTAMFDNLVSGGTLVMTGPTTWPLIEPSDLHRLTRTGVEHYLALAGFTDVMVEDRGPLAAFPGFELHLGWQAVARA